MHCNQLVFLAIFPLKKQVKSCKMYVLYTLKMADINDYPRTLWEMIIDKKISQLIGSLPIPNIYIYIYTHIS